MTSQKPISVILLFGGIATLGLILVTFCTYKAGVVTFLNPAGLLMYLIPVIFGVIAALVERRRQGGFLEFRSTLRIIFGILVMATALQGLFTWLLVNVLDPHFGQALRPVWLENSASALRRIGVTGDDLDRNIAALKETDPFGFGAVAFGLAKIYMVLFPVTLVLALLIKRKKPAEAPATTL